MANIGAYSDVLAVDMVGGLVVGAVAERLGGKLCFFFGVTGNILYEFKLSS
jgi:tRNA (adenine-N(1)-)-methyltransferase non-catalytic subunit